MATLYLSADIRDAIARNDVSFLNKALYPLFKAEHPDYIIGKSDTAVFKAWVKDFIANHSASAEAKTSSREKTATKAKSGSGSAKPKSNAKSKSKKEIAKSNGKTKSQKEIAKGKAKAETETTSVVTNAKEKLLEQFVNGEITANVLRDLLKQIG